MPPFGAPLITPIRWADKTAEEIARNVDKQMEDEAEQSFLYPLKQLRNQEDSDKPLWNLASGLFRKECPNAPVEAEAQASSDCCRNCMGECFIIIYSSFMQMRLANFDDNFCVTQLK